MTSTVLSTILSLVAVLVTPDASGGGHAGREHHGAKAERMCQAIQCTEGQQAKIESIRAEHRQDMADERARAKELHAALKAERSAARPDAKKIESLRAELSALRVAMKEDRREARSEIEALLTPAQQEKLAAMKAEHRAKKGDRKGDRKGAKGDRKGAEGKRGGKEQARARGKRGERGSKEFAKVGPQGERRGKARAQGKGKGASKAFAARGRENGNRGSFEG